LLFLMATRGVRAAQDRAERDSGRFALSAVLSEHQEQIASAWAESLHHLPGSFCADLPPEEVRSLTLRGVGAIGESLETRRTDALDEYLTDFCPAGRRAAPCASAAAEALLLFKDAAVPVIRNVSGADSSAAWEAVSQLDDCLRGMVGRLNSICIGEMSRRLADESARVQTLLSMAQTVGSTLELDEVVSRASEQIVAALGVDACTFHLVDEQQGAVVFIERPSDWSSRVSRSLDTYSGAFHEVLATRKPLTSYDVQSDSRFPQERIRQLGYRSALGVPLMAGGRVVAMAWAYTVDEHRRFTQEEIALAQGMGNILGLVVRSARLAERAKLLAVLEERARLGREIHDGFAQTLGALQLKASQLEESLSRQLADQSHSQLAELQDMISRAYRDLREAMLGLRAAVEPGTDLITVLNEYLGHYRAQYGLEVRLEAGDDQPPILDGEAQAQAMRILQEALRNVHRHAGIERATVRVEREDGGLRICVLDEGRGFDAAALEGQKEGIHLGLRTMRERAASVGGTITVESEPGRGTSVVLDLPLPGDWEKV
jgi:two-component system nitrate/nitrite sensor histidine kinase NarX